MVLIPPGLDCYGGDGGDASGLIASIKCALAFEAPFDTQNLCFRALGKHIVIEGLVNAPGGDEFIRRIADSVAGPARVLVRVGCPKADPSTDS